MTPRPARRRWRRILLTLALILVAGMVLTLGLFDYLLRRASDPLDVSLPAGDDTPFRERQALEDYAATVPPAVIEFQERLTESGAGEWRNTQTSYEFSVDSCSEHSNKRGSQIHISASSDRSISSEEVTRIGNPLFTEIGFSFSEASRENRQYAIWTDWRNGGYLRVTISSEHVGISGNSECRPSTDPERVRFELQALVPLPSESPVQPDSPAPTHTRSIVTRCTRTGETHP